jgi:hypothetical protein
MPFQSNPVHIINRSMLYLFYAEMFGLNLPHQVGRMMMNIRGLIMGDPEHTTHLQTLQFAAPANAGSEIEEVA